MYKHIYAAIFILVGSAKLEAQHLPNEKIQKAFQDSALHLRIKFKDSLLVTFKGELNDAKSSIDKIKSKEQKSALTLKIDGFKDTIIVLSDVALLLRDSLLFQYEHELQKWHFFNLKDTTVFDSRFEEIDTQGLPVLLHRQYHVISQIRKLARQLMNINIKINQIKVAPYYQPSNEKAKAEVVKANIAKDIDEADDTINKIDKEDLSCLSAEQLQYYRPILIERFNQYLNMTFINE